ncbi:hypothetical protein KTT_48790 [Tengunoibacter tsumagoiensis]|uniref:EamA domain-containing protein n=2 Tax=Tengunoibacter tsumagoiensis TaxID=2014871 RepID=A0A402A799_9CHLR|nr:hypothetical protein KTT_48790 [Tengunoibacter tsumagoiensis]
MVIEMLLYAFFFGHWQVVHFILPQDNLTFAYVGLATTLLPMITMITMRRYVNGVLLTFLGTLEPVAGAAFAYLFAHERFGPFVYLSGALIVGSLVLQAWTSTTEKPMNEKEKHQPFQQERLLQTSVSRMYLPQGRYTQQLLTTLWPMSEGVDLPTLHCLTGLPSGSLHRFLSILKKRGYIISYQNARMIPCYRIHPSWCVSTHLQLDFNR